MQDVPLEAHSLCFADCLFELPARLSRVTFMGVVSPTGFTPLIWIATEDLLAAATLKMFSLLLSLQFVPVFSRQ